MSKIMPFFKDTANTFNHHRACYSLFFRKSSTNTITFEEIKDIDELRRLKNSNGRLELQEAVLLDRFTEVG